MLLGGLYLWSDQPWQKIDDVIKYAKQHPGEIKFAHSGIGTLLHVAGELFAKEAEINITQVPFRGGPESLAALLGGHVQLMFTSLPTIKGQVENGDVRVLAVTAEQRIANNEYKDIPTFKEQGLNIVLFRRNGIAVPKDMPENMKNILSIGLEKIFNDPEFIDGIKNYGFIVKYRGPKESAAQWLSENALDTKIIQETGIAEQIAAQKNR